MKEIFVPQLGESVTEAQIVEINKKAGEYVQEDEQIFLLETDKVTTEVNSPVSGTVKEVKCNIGDVVGVNALLATVDEGVASQLSDNSSSDTDDNVIKSVNDERVAMTGVIHGKQNSPAAKVIMGNNNISSEQIIGNGRDGRITKRDVLVQKDEITKPKHSNVLSDITCEQEERIVPMSKIRQTIAINLKKSQNTAAILTTFNEVDMQNVMLIRSRYKEAFEKKYKIKLGFMSFFIKAAIAALKEIPEINAEIRSNDIIYKDYYNIGIAVGTQSGLVVPVIKNAQNLSVAQIEKEVAGFGKKAKDNKITMQDMKGGTFTISNGGVYGSLMSTPILNPPQSGILGMHSIKERPVAVNGKIEIRPMMYLALSYDHRIVDGQGAVVFLVKVKNYIENPERLVLEI